MKKILGIIPARYGSTRLEGKPLVMICGKTMIQRVYEQSKKALDHVIVATDDKRIFDAVKNFDGQAVMTSENHTTGTNRCLEAYNLYVKQTDLEFDIVLNIQGDEPLLEPTQLTKLVSCFNDTKTTMATLVMPTYEQEDLQSGVFVVVNKENYALYFSRSVIPFVRDDKFTDWHKNHTFLKHIGLYGFLPKTLKEFSNLNQTKLENSEKLEQLRWLENGNSIKVAITNHKSISVDTKEDVLKVIKIIEKQS
jgi:3-deoxy-manno-octulosonate cytidylyltransferase (CMP-KDO synthetase)